MYRDPETGETMQVGDGNPDYLQLAEYFQAVRWVEQNLEQVDEPEASA